MDPFIGQIMQVGFSYAPRGWMTCQGQMLSISQNSAMFSLLGTNFGGNGQTTFGLPDARGRMMVGTGQGPSLPPVVLGQMAGTPSVTLDITQMPAHNHTAAFTGQATPLSLTSTLSAVTAPTSQTNTPTDGALLTNPPNAGPGQVKIYAPANSGGAPVNLGGLKVMGGSVTAQGQVVIGMTGNNQPVAIMPPYVGVTTIIATEGLFPSRN